MTIDTLAAADDPTLVTPAATPSTATPSASTPSAATTSASTPSAAVGLSDAEGRVLDAAKACCDRWGMAKVTVDDIASEAGVSRATLYRLFPGGRDVLFDALRARETGQFFDRLSRRMSQAENLEDLVVHVLVEATRELRADEHLQLMLASAPGDVAADLTIAGLPRIFAEAERFLAPRIASHIGEARSAQLAEWLSRVVLSFFLAPSVHVDLGDEASARTFAASFVLPAFTVPAVTGRP